MDAVLLAALAGLLFGAMAVAVRTGLGRVPDAKAGAAALAGAAVATSTALALVSGAIEGDLRVALEPLWPFLLAGAFVPGLSQLLFVLAVRAVGASRTAILVGTAPLGSALLALAFLGEPFRPALAVGTVAIVLGGATLAWERTEAGEVRLGGAALALLCALLFAGRDNIVRWAAVDTGTPPLQAASASLAAAAAVLLAYLLGARGKEFPRHMHLALPAFLPAGVFLGLAYSALLEAFARGRVTVVAPLNATQSLWALVIAALVIGRRAEAIGPRVVAAALLVVAGSVLIGASE